MKHSQNLFFPIWTFTDPQEFFNNIFKTEPSFLLNNSRFSNKNVVFQQLSNLRSIEYSFFQFSIGQLGELRRYILETWSPYILKLTSEVCSILCWSDLKTEFTAAKSMKSIRCWSINCCSNSFVLKLCYELLSNIANLASLLNSAAWNP